MASSSSAKRKDRFSVDFQRVEQGLIDQEELKCVDDSYENRTPDASPNRSIVGSPDFDSSTLISQLRTNLSRQQGAHRLPGVTLLRVEMSPPPPFDETLALAKHIWYSLRQLKNGVVSKDMVDAVKESVRSLRSKGYSNLNDDEAIQLKNDIRVLSRLESSPSQFREKALKFFEEIPSLVRCLRQRQQTSIEQPNLVQDLNKHIVEIQNHMEALVVEDKQFDEEILLNNAKMAKTVEQKEVIRSKMIDLYRESLNSTCILSYVDGEELM